MPTESLAADPIIAMIPLCIATVAALLGGAIVWRRFDRQTAVCALPFLTISGYDDQRLQRGDSSARSGGFFSLIWADSSA
ncbi:MAG: hypothetical protein C0483_11270 [Pirellula sp.]|nr:hypothetical protein [Pirellula sp.]